jgi:hypothetical protein
MNRGGARAFHFVPVLFLVSFLVAGGVVAAKKRFWMDELFTWHVVTAPTAPDCLAAVADQLESNPPLYFLAAWAFGKFAGTDEISLRLFSAAAMALALAILYATLRRPFGRRGAALGVALALGGSPLVWEQNAEARPYALYLATFAAALAAHAGLARSPGFFRGVLVALAHAALVYVQALGAAFAGALWAAMVASDLLGGRRRISWIAPLVGIASFAAWRGPFLADLDVGKPHSWIAPPALPALPEAFSNGVPVALGVAMIFGIAMLRRPAAGAAASADAASRRQTGAKILGADAAQGEGARAEVAATGVGRDPRGEAGSPTVLGATTDGETPVRRELILAAVFAAVGVPLAAFVVSRLGTSIFLDRYFLPGTAGWAVLFAALARATIADSSGRLAAACTAGVLCAAAAAPVVAAVRAPDQSTTGALPKTAAAFPDLPVAFETPHWYLPAFHYEPHRERFFYILDWEAALAEGSDLNSAVDYKLLKSLAARFPQHQVIESDAFLARHSRFLVVGFSVRRWSEMRLEGDPRYRVKPLGQFVYLVERLADDASRPTSR